MTAHRNPKGLRSTQNPTALKGNDAPSKEVSSTRSESSTIFRHQTPFTKYRGQVEGLCNSLWPASRLVIDRLRGGIYGGFVGIKTKIEGASQHSGEEQLILRVPGQAWKADLKTEVATLLYVRQHAVDIPIPQIKAFDLTDVSNSPSPHLARKLELRALWPEHGRVRISNCSLGYGTRTTHSTHSIPSRHFCLV